jgi:hypothetical protein
MDPMTTTNLDEFRETIRAEFHTAWETLRQKHPSEHFYAFGLYTTTLASYLMVTASTDEGLETVTQDYVKRYGGDPKLQRASLRWSTCDSPIHLEGKSLLPISSILRCEGPDPEDDELDSDAFIDSIFEAAVEALRQLDRDGVFGAGLERDGLVLGIWKGDQSNEDRIKFARMLNPDAVVDRYARELAQGLSAFNALSANLLRV